LVEETEEEAEELKETGAAVEVHMPGLREGCTGTILLLS
jgi:hypothetical protein